MDKIDELWEELFSCTPSHVEWLIMQGVIKKFGADDPVLAMIAVNIRLIWVTIAGPDGTAFDVLGKAIASMKHLDEVASHLRGVTADLYVHISDVGADVSKTRLVLREAREMVGAANRNGPLLQFQRKNFATTIGVCSVIALFFANAFAAALLSSWLSG